LIWGPRFFNGHKGVDMLNNIKKYNKMGSIILISLIILPHLLPVVIGTVSFLMRRLLKSYREGYEKVKEMFQGGNKENKEDKSH
jgi:hypothetical protein